jgi:hypothetical protein
MSASAFAAASLADKVEIVVNDILRDKESGWRHDYFRHQGTSVDQMLAKAIAGLDREELKASTAVLRAKLSSLEKSKGAGVDLEKIELVETMRSRLAVALRDMDFESDKSRKEAIRQQIELTRKEIAQMRSDMKDLTEKEILRIKALLTKADVEMLRLGRIVGSMEASSWASEVTKWGRVQARENRRRRELQELRNTFMQDGSLDALRAGVAKVESA